MAAVMSTRDHLTLRPGIETDLPSVAGIYLAARAAAEESGTMPPGIHPPPEVRAYVAGWDLTADDLWVAELDGDPVGFAHVRAQWLDSLYVDPRAQGRGVGSALLDLVKATRESFGLWVFVSNTPAREFYRRHGLVEVARTDGRDNEERAPDIHLGWSS